MFKILLFIVFTTCILAAPTQNQNSIQWSKLKEDKSLERFQSTLLNEKFLPFLDECYNTTQLAPNYHTTEIICSIYFDGVIQLNNSGYIVDKPTVVKLRDQANTTDTFCEQKHNFPTKQNFLSFKPMDLNNSGKCGHSCLEDGGSTTKPICRFIAWMGDVLLKNVEVKVPTVVATAPTNVSRVENSSKVAQKIGVLSNQTIEAVKDKITEAVKADAISKKIVFKSANVLSKPQPNNSSEKLIHENKPLDEVKSDIAVKKPSSVEDKHEVKADAKPHSSDQNKVDIPDTKQNLDEDKVDIPDVKQNLDEAKIDIPDTKQNLDEGKVDIALTTLNSSAQVPSKPNEDIMYSSDENDTDEENVDLDVKSRIPITNPENEQNHSSSQEIISSKVIAAATTTTNKKKEDPFNEQSGSNFFTYLLIAMFLCIAMYVSYHNKSKILALVLEGRRGDKGRSGRRKHTAAYRKLDSNLEEAITSSARGRTTQIIY